MGLREIVHWWCNLSDAEDIKRAVDFWVHTDSFYGFSLGDKE